MDAQSISKTKLALLATIPARLSSQLQLMIVLFLLVCLVDSAQGQTSSAQWWNPTTWGSQDDSVRKSSYFSNTPKKSTDKPLLSMPQMPWSGDKKDKGAEQQVVDPNVATTQSSSAPSMFNKMSQTTKRTWNNTVDFLNPFEKKPAQPVQQGYQPQNMTKKKGSGMFGWMWREETTETPTSVNEFLRQERPRF